MFDRLPFEIEPCEIFAEPVSIVRRFAIFPCRREEFASRGRKRG